VTGKNLLDLDLDAKKSEVERRASIKQEEVDERVKGTETASEGPPRMTGYPSRPTPGAI